jgi:hypothetical protein
MVIMLVGAISFSFFTGSLSSIISDYDKSNAKMQHRINVLNRIYKDHGLSLDLYQRLRQAILYDSRKDMEEEIEFVGGLPPNLQTEVSL